MEEIKRFTENKCIGSNQTLGYKVNRYVKFEIYEYESKTVR